VVARKVTAVPLDDSVYMLPWEAVSGSTIVRLCVPTSSTYASRNGKLGSDTDEIKIDPLGELDAEPVGEEFGLNVALGNNTIKPMISNTITSTQTTIFFMYPSYSTFEYLVASYSHWCA
jgi:hypothetical protein